MMDGIRSGTAAFLVAAALLAAVGPADAQHQGAPPPAAYALRDVTLFHPDGRQLDRVNIVVRRGLIAAMGPGVAIPDDALLLEDDSLRVYPGLVDAHGKVDLEMPERDNSQRVLPWDASREAQGFTPHRLAAHFLMGAGEEGKDARMAGTIAAGVHPTGGMAPGQSVAVLFRKGARTPWETVAQPSTGLSFSFQGARGVYPGTLFAVMAMFRQTFEDANREGLIRSEYGRDPRGLPVPPWDPDFEALRRAASGDLPVFFHANSAGDIRRVLALAGEIGFRTIIVGGEEAWRVADDLLAGSIPVLVSVDFPVPTQWKPSETGEDSGVQGPPGGEMEWVAAQEVVLEPGAAKEKERLENAYANAGRLVEAGVSVALTSGGSGEDLLEGIRKAMEYGLSEGAALRGVTTVPASLLGIPNVVTVGEGLAANFIVTDGPLFREGTSIRYTFVEGEMEEGAGPGLGGEAPAVNVSGEWDLVISAGGMEISSTATMVQESATFSGSMTSDEMGEIQIQNGRVAGAQVSFDLVFSMGTESMTVSARGRVDGDRFTGSGSSEMGDFTFTATRKPGSKGGLR
jgi:imidazolonepropionase-like amidohydrolase